VSHPGVSAVVVVHGSPAVTVDACIESLIASVDVDVHIILVNNASPDNGAACRRWQGHRQVTTVDSVRNDGFAAGVNQGLAHLRANNFVLLLNDDAFVSPQALAKLVELLAADSTLIAAAPRVMLADEPDRIDSLGVVLRPTGEAFNAYIGQPWTGQLHDGADIFGPCFGAAMFRHNAFDDATGVGRLDQRYRLYYEDVDWALRAQRRGFRSALATQALVYHQHAASTRLMGEAKRYELVQRNLLLCATKNLTWASVVRIWAGRLIAHAKGVIKGPYRVPRLASLVRALAGSPSAVLARRGQPNPQRAETDLFGYSNGLSPQFDVTTYRSSATKTTG
jgi:GT2 family glycosyltransferase